MRYTARSLVLPPLPLGEGWGEGRVQASTLPFVAFTLTLSEGHEGAPSWPSESEQEGSV
jgi:hypothetical protein